MVSAHLAVLGSPIEHSKSPAIHAAAYEALGLDWDYGRYRIEAGELSTFLNLRDSTWRGLSLTMPLKQIGYEISTPSCPVASATGVVNTLLHTDSGWEGYNTDSFGITKSVTEREFPTFKQINVLGSGATAISAVYAASQINPDAQISVFSRSKALIQGIESQSLVEFYEREAEGLTISTLPGSVIHPGIRVAADSVVLDVAYDPWPSSLSLNWASQNRISGFEMLLWQALVQVRIFYYGDGTKTLPNEEQVFEAMRNSVKA